MADDANRDEVQKCKRIAETALSNGDAEKAIRFLQKAKRMCPGDTSVDDLLAKAQSGDFGGAQPSAGNSTPTNDNSAPSGPRVRPSAAGSASASPPTSSGSAGGTRTGKDGRTYTAEQMQLVQRILRTKDYYAILEIDKGSNEDQVKRAYKKIALKLHPDKNKAPGAEEAFKKLSKAVQCLTDADKKQVYDRYGDEDQVPQHHRHHQQDFMTAEDLFAAFFGGGSVQQGRHNNNHQNQGGGQPGEGGQVQRANLLHMLPVLLLILTLASNFTSNSGSGRFSLTETGQYRHERNTPSLDVSYYVTDDFGDHYGEGTRELAEFERQVEIYGVRNLHSECDFQEKTMYKKVMIAKRRGSQEDLQSARRHPKPACKQIEKVKKSYPNIYRAAMYMGVY